MSLNISINKDKLVKAILVTAGGLLIGKLLKSITNSICSKLVASDIQKTINEYKEKRKKEIVSFLSKERFELSESKKSEIITLSSMTELSSNIKSGKYTVREVAIAFLTQALTIGEEYNLLADINIGETLSLADEKDKELKVCKDPQTLPDLFGVPISIKENIPIKGFLSTFGYGIRTKSLRDQADSYVVKILKENGAIPLVKSNVPQGYMAYDSANNIYGRALNPWNKGYVAGGSSGGEAGLVASFCTMGGIGSDLGGSIRIPSSYCGVYGLKPSSSRISKLGSISFDGTPYFSLTEKVSYGVLTKNINDLELMCKTLFGKFSYDKYAYQSKYQSFYQNDKDKKIKIGFLLDISGYETCVSIKSQISKILTHLKEAYPNKYEIIELDINKYINASNYETSLVKSFHNVLMNSGFFEIIQETTKGEKLQSFYQGIASLKEMTKLKKYFTVRLLNLMGQKRLSIMLDNYKQTQNIHEFNLLKSYNNRLAEEFLNDLKSNNIDILCLPNSIVPAFKINSNMLPGLNSYYQLLFNVTDMPSASVPIGFLDDISYSSSVYNDVFTKEIKESLSDGLGLPLSLQLAALPFEEELLISVIKDISSLNYFTHEDSKKVFHKIKN